MPENGDARQGASIAPKLKNAEILAAILQVAIKWGSLVAIAYFGMRSIVAMAGETTVADLGVTVGFFGSVRVNMILGWATGLSGVLYGVLQTRLRRRTTERLQARISTLEISLDPSRTSSGLPPSGETRLEDK